MAAKFSIDVQGKRDCWAFDPFDIEFSKFTGRQERSDEQIDAMVQSLLAYGQEQPIKVRKGFDGKPIAVSGHTRILAARRITERKLSGTVGGKEEVQFSPDNPFVVYGVLGQMNDLEAAVHTFVENDGDSRTPLNPVDVAFTIRTFGEVVGLKDSEIAEKLHKPAQWVSDHRKILDLDSGTQEQVRSGSIGLAAAKTAAKIDPAQRPAAIEKAKQSGKGRGRAKGKVSAASLASAARSLGANTASPLKRTDSDFKVWVAQRIAQYSETTGAKLDFLRAIQGFRAGTASDAELTRRFEAL